MVNLRKPYARYVATVVTGWGGTVRTHGIRGSWRYDRTNRTTCGKVASGVEHTQSGRALMITCKNCT